MAALSCGLAGAHEGSRARIAALSDRIEREDQDAILFIERADAFLAAGDPFAAMKDLISAERLDPKRRDLSRAWARLHLARGHPDLALQSLERIPPDARCATEHELAARAHTARGEHARAARAWERVLDRTRGTPDQWHALVEALVADGRPRDALQAANAGLRRIGPCISLELLAVELEERTGRVDAALARLSELSRRSRRPESIRLRMAEVLERAGRASEALAEIDAVLLAIARLPRGVRARAMTLDLERKATRMRDRIRTAAESG